MKSVTSSTGIVRPSGQGERLPQPHTNLSTAKRDVLSTTVVHLPLGVGDVTTGALCAAVAIFAAATGWWITGAAVAVPLALVGGVALAAAIEDSHTGRIPNGLVLTGITIVASSWGFVAILDNRMMGPLALDVFAGLALGGAPVVFLIWLVAPRLIGGGDWKLLVVLGAVVGVPRPGLGQCGPDGRVRGGGRGGSHRSPTTHPPRTVPRRRLRRCHRRCGRRAGAVRQLVPRDDGGVMKTFQDTGKETRLSNSTIAATASPRSGSGPAAPAPGSPAAVLASKPGLRMRPHRPMRALAGALIVVASVVAALALYTRIGNRTEVLAVSRDVLAGEQIDDADLEVVSMSSDDGDSHDPGVATQCRRRPVRPCAPAGGIAARRPTACNHVRSSTRSGC